MGRTWTVDERIDAFERRGTIEIPFTADERSLARAVAEALYFAFHLTELPGRYPRRSAAYSVVDITIMKVLGKREALPVPRR